MDISRITLGAASLGIAYGISGRPLRQEPEQILETAYKLGIKSIDTARAYGNSEQILGRYLKTNNHWKPRITTKINVESVSADDLRDEINRKLDDSMLKLGQDSLYAVFVHRYEALSRHGQILASVMEELKAQKKVNKIGISVYNPQEMADSMRYEQFEIFQGPVNIFDRRLYEAGLLAKLKKQKKYFFARSAFLQGLFFLDDETIKAKIPGALPYVKALRGLSADYDLPIESIAMSYVKDMDGITGLVIGVKSIRHLKDPLALFSAKPLPEDLKKKIKEKFSGIEQDILDPRVWPVQSYYAKV